LGAINRKFGKGTLGYGYAALRRKWDMRRGYMSKAYSTNWDDLLKVRSIQMKDKLLHGRKPPGL